MTPTLGQLEAVPKCMSPVKIGVEPLESKSFVSAVTAVQCRIHHSDDTCPDGLIAGGHRMGSPAADLTRQPRRSAKSRTAAAL
jgi:hypothetical protein